MSNSSPSSHALFDIVIPRSASLALSILCARCLVMLLLLLLLAAINARQIDVATQVCGLWMIHSVDFDPQ